MSCPRWPLPILALTLAVSPASAETTGDLGVFTSVLLTAGLHGSEPTGPRLWTDLHARRAESGFVGIVRPGIGWDLARGLTLTAGYAWIATDAGGPDTALASEHRIWEQLLFQRTLDSGLGLGIRGRLEQRRTPDQAEIGHRARLWGRGALPLSGPVSLVLTDEAFLGLNQTGSTPSGFDQNRLFLGPAVPIGDFGRLEIGYLNVFLNRDTDTLLHVVAANLFVAL